jgi:hypothetical protein
MDTIQSFKSLEVETSLSGHSSYLQNLTGLTGQSRKFWLLVKQEEVYEKLNTVN